MDHETLVSGVILIVAWRLKEERAARASVEDIAGALPDLQPICDLVEKIAERDKGAVAQLRLLEHDPDNAHARAALQRHLGSALRAEPADHAELLKLLLNIGDVTSSDKSTWITLPRAAQDSSSGDNPIVVSIEIPRSSQVPARLTPPSGTFCGREEQMAEVLLRAESELDGVQVFAVSGPLGYGTSEFCRAVADAMYRGKSSRLQIEVSIGKVRSSEDALFDALVAMGVRPQEVPAGQGERAQHYRNGLTDLARRLGTRPVILVDDARALKQVRPFLLNCSGVVLVTGNFAHSDSDLFLTTMIELGPLSPRHSLQLLSSRMRRRGAVFEPTSDDLAALKRIVQFCQGVPLALALMASVLESAASAGGNLHPLADELERAHYGLGQEPPELRAALAALHVSYAHLPAGLRSMLHGIALLRLPVLDVNIAAAASGERPREVHALLEQLVSFSLLERLGADGSRWRMHALVQKFIEDLLPESVKSRREEILAAAARLYLRRAHSLAALFKLSSARSSPAIAEWAQEQLQWQRPALVALLRAALDWGLTKTAHALALAVAGLIEITGEWPDTLLTAASIAEASRLAEDPDLEARAVAIVARHEERRQQPRSARDLYARAAALSGNVRAPAKENGPVASDEDVAAWRPVVPATDSDRPPAGQQNPDVNQPASVPSALSGTSTHDAGAQNLHGNGLGNQTGRHGPVNAVVPPVGGGPDGTDSYGGAGGGGPDNPDNPDTPKGGGPDGGPGGGPGGGGGGPGGGGFIRPRWHGDPADPSGGSPGAPGGGTAIAGGLGAGIGHSGGGTHSAAGSSSGMTRTHAAIEEARGGGQPTTETTFGSCG